MNEQKSPGGIEWCRIYGRRGFTLNPIRGCTHQCGWLMPDGTVSLCYAKTIAERLLPKAYPGGFENVTYHPAELNALTSLKDPAGIFLDSMSDLFGVGTKMEWTDAVLEAAAQYPQHIFFALTKNPPRLRYHNIPKNVWTGISAPPTFMFGRELTDGQQQAWFKEGLGHLLACTARVRWLSLEPLSIDLSSLIQGVKHKIDWAVIGAASDGRRTHQPDVVIFRKTMTALDPVPVFFKGNINRAMAVDVAGRWREDFPDPDSI